MNSLIMLLIVELGIIVIPSFFCFRNKQEFVKCFYSFLFVESFSRWQRVYHKHIQRSLRFTVYFIIVLFASALNVIFRDAITDAALFDDSMLSVLKLVNGYSDFFLFSTFFI